MFDNYNNIIFNFKTRKMRIKNVQLTLFGETKIQKI